MRRELKAAIVVMLCMYASLSQAAGKWQSKDAATSTGVYVQDEGGRYEGGFKGESFEGQGTYTFPNGIVSTGLWSNDQLVRGKTTWPSGQFEEGEYRNMQLNGPGRLVTREGFEFAGNFVNGRLSSGQMTRPDAIYKGGFDDRFNRSGRGIETGNNGTLLDGEWVADVFVSGTQVLANGYRYEGSFVDGHWEGQGQLTMGLGRAYAGEFRGGKASGKGRMVYTDGSVHVGLFENGVPNGYGVRTYVGPGYRNYEGEWKDGKYHGKGAVTTWSGEVVAGRYENGNLVERSNRDSGPSFGQMLAGVAGAAVVAKTGGVSSPDKVRLASSYIADVTGDGSGSATASTVAELKRRQASAAGTTGAPAAPATSSSSGKNGCIGYGQIGNREGMAPECFKGKQSAFGWGDSQAAACSGAQDSYKQEFASFGKNPSGCYCKANATVNTVVQPYVCWVMFD